MRRLPIVLAVSGILFVCGLALRRPADAQQKPPITLDEFFNSVDFTAVRISPDGGAVAIATERADWDANRNRDDLWLYRAGAGEGALTPLTQSGHDHSPQWSPDSRWIAFLSDRAAEKSKGAGDEEDAAESSEKSEAPEHLYVISTTGGEAFPASDGDDSVHSFAWSADSRSIFFATKHPRSKEEKAAQKKVWKDVIRFRESERGDEIFRVDVAAVESAWMKGAPTGDLAPATHEIAAISERVAQLDISPNGERLAFFTEPRSEREESIDPYAIYVIELGAAGAAGAAPPRLVSHTSALYEQFVGPRTIATYFFHFCMVRWKARIRMRSSGFIGWMRGLRPQAAQTARRLRTRAGRPASAAPFLISPFYPLEIFSRPDKPELRYRRTRSLRSSRNSRSARDGRACTRNFRRRHILRASRSFILRWTGLPRFISPRARRKSPRRVR